MEFLIDIKWLGDYGGTADHYQISNPAGNASSFDIKINNYHQGTLHKVRGEWHGYFNARSKVGTEDVPTLSFIIENELERLRLLKRP